jgi:hypothetical protein
VKNNDKAQIAYDTPNRVGDSLFHHVHVVGVKMTLETVKMQRLKLPLSGEIDIKYYGDDKFGTVMGHELDAPIYDYPAMRWLSEHVRQAVDHKFDQVMMVTGLERVGKTSLTMGLADQMDVNGDFPLENLAFTAKEMISIINRCKPLDVVVLDEAGAAMFSEEWMTREQRDLVKVFQTMGIRNLKLILVLPHRGLLNFHLRNRRLHYWLHCYSMGYARGWCRMRKAVPNEFQIETWFEPVFTFKFPDYQTLGEKQKAKWDTYEKRKWEFVGLGVQEHESVPERQHRSRLYKTILALADEKMPYAKIGTITGLSESAIQRMVSDARRHPEKYSGAR